MSSYIAPQPPVNPLRSRLLADLFLDGIRIEHLSTTRSRVIAHAGEHVLAVSFHGDIDHPRNRVGSKLRHALGELAEVA